MLRRRPGGIVRAGLHGGAQARCPAAAPAECELIDRSVFRTHAQARTAIFEFIEGWHNPHRRHPGSVISPSTNTS
jgi:hypothetical protein